MKMNQWENMYIQIYRQQDQRITEQQINENPLYELAQLHTHYETVHKQITNRQEHQTHTGKSGLLQIKCLTFHILDIMNIMEIILRNCCITDDIHMRPHYCVIQTQISGRSSNGTKHSGGAPEDGREKKPKHVRGFILTNTFLTFHWF